LFHRKAEWDDAIGKEGLVVLDCFATWCGPCKMIAPKIVEYVLSSPPPLPLPSPPASLCSSPILSFTYTDENRFSKQYTDVRFYKVDVDEVPDLAQELGIRAMPTFVLFKNGEKVDEVVGANPKAIEAAITKNQ
jgi:thioredoxin 1